MKVFLTRALSQVRLLESLVKNSGNQPILFPALYIKAIAIKITPNKHYNYIIFISANAVDYGIKILNALPNDNYKLLCIGVATAKKLANYGFKAYAFPQSIASSATLLMMDKVKCITNSNILIIKGKGGNNTLKKSLTKARNIVECISVYERIQSKIEPLHKKSLQEFLADKGGIITITSIDILTAMVSIIKEININAVSNIKNYPLIALSKKIGAHAKKIGFNNIKIAPQTSDNGIIKAINLIEPSGS